MRKRRFRPIDRLVYHTREAEPEQGFIERVVRPLVLRVTGFGGRFMTRQRQHMLRERLMHAGFPGKLQVHQWMSFKILLALVYPCGLVGVAAPLVAIFRWQFSSLHFLILVFTAAFLGWLTPDFILTKIIAHRKRMIQKTLPDMIDLMTVSVEAGLGFDGALQRVSSYFKGPLGDEVQRTMHEILLGRPRIEALREMARRTDVQDVTNFVTALVQADLLGVSIGNVLRVQSNHMREVRFQRAREAAQKAPLKMTFPLVLFIFPALFVVIMGPACIRSADIFRGAF